MTFYLYILESKKDKSFYIGQTQNLENRLKKHNAGYVRSTKFKRPWKLIFSIEVKSRSEAVRLESKLKKFKKREAVINFINTHTAKSGPEKL